MKRLLQRMAVFLAHVIDSPNSSPETVEAAKELERDVVDAINGNYQEESSDGKSDDEER